MAPLFLTLEEVMEIHVRQIEKYGGTESVRDMSLLESALATPQAGLGDQYLHIDLFERAAAYLFHIVQNHPFLDGNKRVGAATALVFLETNGRRSENHESNISKDCPCSRKARWEKPPSQNSS